MYVITERRDLGLYNAPLSMFLLSFGIETMLANFNMSYYFYFVLLPLGSELW